MGKKWNHGVKSHEAPFLNGELQSVLCIGGIIPTKCMTS